MRLLLGSRLGTLAAALAVMVVGLVPQYLSRTLPDIAFLLHAGERVLAGERLYVDLLEINPPLVVWLNIPVVLAAHGADVSAILAYRIAVTLLLLGSVYGCHRVLRCLHGADASPPFRRGFLLLIVFALFVLPRLDWGEREHLMLALMLPYLVLGGVRLEGSRVPRGMAISTGVAAAIGIALKPQMVLVWIAREGVVALRGRRRPTLEGAVVAGAGAVYLVAVLVATPEYLPLVRELGSAYRTYLHDPLLLTALLGEGAALVLGALLVSAALWRRPGSRALRLVLVAAVAAGYLAAVLQQKGWRYHFYPALALGWVLLAVVAASARRHHPLGRLARRMEVRWTDRLFVAIAGAAVVTVGTVATAGALVQAARPLDPRYDADPSIGLLAPMLRSQAAGEPVLVLSPNMASGFPLTTYAGTQWPQRFSNLWPLVAAYDSALHSTAPLRLRPAGEATAVERRLRATVTEDFIRSRPVVVLVLATGPDEPRWGMRRLDLLDFLTRDQRFAAALAGYTRRGIMGQYEVYVRADRAAAFQLPAAPPVLADGGPPAGVALDADALKAAAFFLLALLVFYRRAGTAPAFA